MADKLISANNFKQYCWGGLIECEDDLKAAGKFEFAKMVTEEFIKDIDEQPPIPYISMESVLAILDKIRAELHATAEMHEDGNYYIRDEWIDEYFNKYKAESDPQEGSDKK